MCKLTKNDDISIRHSSWIPKSDLVRLIGRKATDIKLKEIWDNQEKRHLEGLKFLNKPTGRSVSPFPLETFAKKREQRGRSRRLSVAAKTPTALYATDKYDEGYPEPSERQIANFQPTQPVIKEEPEDGPLFVSSDLPTKEKHETRSSDPTELQNSENNSSEGPLRFSFESFMTGVSKKEKWNSLSDAERQKQKADAEVRYDRYKEVRLRQGDICEDDE